MASATSGYCFEVTQTDLFECPLAQLNMLLGSELESFQTTE
ncbi:MAG: hypothetical protein QOH65_2440 [Methylobacteriaceae bacterium]|nr:hypothetical protein [Methylobacteriaceae bacterium]